MPRPGFRGRRRCSLESVRSNDPRVWNGPLQVASTGDEETAEDVNRASDDETRPRTSPWVRFLIVPTGTLHVRKQDSDPLTASKRRADHWPGFGRVHGCGLDRHRCARGNRAPTAPRRPWPPVDGGRGSVLGRAMDSTGINASSRHHMGHHLDETALRLGVGRLALGLVGRLWTSRRARCSAF